MANLTETSSAETRERIKEAMEALGDKVVGLAVCYRGRNFELFAIEDGAWVAWSTVDDEEPDEPIAGDSMPTPMCALDNCADACDAIECPNSEDGDE
jgi:hypothetical protein